MITGAGLPAPVVLYTWMPAVSTPVRVKADCSAFCPLPGHQPGVAREFFTFLYSLPYGAEILQPLLYLSVGQSCSPLCTKVLHSIV